MKLTDFLISSLAIFTLVISPTFSFIPPIISTLSGESAAILAKHNQFRSEVIPGPPINMNGLKWHDGLASAAQATAEDCVFEHGDPEWIKEIIGPKLEPVKFEGGHPGATSTMKLWNQDWSPGRAFQRQSPDVEADSRHVDSRPWLSDKVPATVYYNFPHPITVAKFSFRNRREKAHSANNPKDFNFVGSDDCKSWTMIRGVSAVDWGIKQDEEKIWTIDQIDRKKFKCFGIQVLSISGKKSVAIQDLKMWKDGKPIGGQFVGQNLAIGYRDVSAAISAWNNEKKFYDLCTHTCAAPRGKSCGHYTQVVWAETTHVGCGQKRCTDGPNSGKTITVCNYFPGGNLKGSRPYKLDKGNQACSRADSYKKRSINLLDILGV